MQKHLWRTLCLSLLLPGCLFTATPDEPTPCDANERVLSGECVPCAEGSTRASGDDPEAGDTECVASCDEGERVDTNTCAACPSGTTSPAGADPSGADTTCDDIVCGEDERVLDNACVNCPAGSTRQAGDLARGGDTICEPTLCGEDERVLDNTCDACPNGETNLAGDDASGANTGCDDLCPPDHYVSGGECTSCDPGEARPAGDDPNGPDTSCAPVECSANESVVSNECRACPMGTTNEPGDDATGDDTSCAPIRCREDERVLMNRCVECVPGNTNEDGDDASGPNTVCDIVSCDENQYVSSHACTDCAPGSTRLEGDLAAGRDTQCEPVECAQDEYVSSNVCVECGPGTTRPAGDLATDPDTSCAPIRCVVDQRVIGNACASCPPDETNAPGDDASGPDTQCDDACALALGVRCDAFAEAYIKASNTDAEDSFGFALDMDGDTLVVGAHLEDSNAMGINGDDQNDLAPAAGAAYVFERNGTTWTQTAYLKASDSVGGIVFGWSVAIRGATIVVGARREFSDATGVDGMKSGIIGGSGAAYVFEYDGTGWAETAYLKASNTGVNDEFGHSVDTDGQTVVVGARYESNSATGVDPVTDDDLANRAGSAYVFKRDPVGAGWSFDAYLKASNAGAEDQFGIDVAVDGDTIAVGARHEQSGSSNEADDSADQAGAVYIFDRSNGRWSQSAYLKSSNIDAGDRFGFSLDLDGERLVVGAFQEDGADLVDTSDDTATNAGAAYVFERGATGQWVEVAYLKHPDPETADQFGLSVAIDGDFVVVGSWADDAIGVGLNPDPTVDFASNSTVGAVVLFERQANGVWARKAFIKPPNPTQGNRFGYAVAVSGSRLLAGDYFEDSSATGVGGDPFDIQATDSGAVFVRRIAP